MTWSEDAVRDHVDRRLDVLNQKSQRKLTTHLISEMTPFSFTLHFNLSSTHS